MKTKKRLNNFESLPDSKILPGGCSCCSCCCCCLHGMVSAVAGANFGFKEGRTKGTKFLLMISLFIFFGAFGLGLDYLIISGIDKLGNADYIAKGPVPFFGFYFLSVLLFSAIVFKLVSKFTSNIPNKTKHKKELANKKEYHKTRLLFQLKLVVFYILLGFCLGFLPKIFNEMVTIVIISLIVVLIYPFALLIDEKIANIKLTFLFLLFHNVPIVLVLFFGEELLKNTGISTFLLIILLAWFVLAFAFEYCRFRYIKSHPELLKK